MKDLLVIIATTLLVILMWTGLETARISGQSFAPKDLLEISSPIGATIDVSYLSAL